MEEQTKKQAANDRKKLAAAVEHELDIYPLRDASEDARWMLWTVGIWMGIALSLLLFFIVMTILGLFYD